MTILEDLAMTLECCGGAQISEAGARLFASELGHYPAESVHEALARCRREVMGRLSLAHVIERIDDGRPGAEEAWGMIPKTEADSAALTEEMREAMFIAMPLIAIGDLVAARMAFLEAYRRIVSRARAAREQVSWKVSLGHDPTGREAARLDLDQRLGIAHDSQSRIAGPREEVSDLEPIRQVIGQLAQARSLERAQQHESALAAADQAHAEGRRCETGCDRCMPIPEGVEIERLRLVSRKP